MNQSDVWIPVSIIRLKMGDDTEYAPANNKLYSPVVRFMKPYAESRDIRLEMLRTATGISQIGSTKHLTAHTCITLIGEWKSDDNWDPSTEAEDFLKALAGYVERQPSFEQRENDYLRWLVQHHMSDV